jgi:thiosulfate dehydrogenase [quinone] large subunit
MLVAFFESIKYVGHLFPLTFLRVYLGYVYFNSALERFHSSFLRRPELAAQLSEWLPQSAAPAWYKDLIIQFVIPSPNWKIASYLLSYCEAAVGLSLLAGFLVRPASLLGILLCLNGVYLAAPREAAAYQTHLVIFITLLWLGAGRCLGFDYFFFKRQRGIWW